MIFTASSDYTKALVETYDMWDIPVRKISSMLYNCGITNRLTRAIMPGLGYALCGTPSWPKHQYWLNPSIEENKHDLTAAYETLHYYHMDYVLKLCDKPVTKGAVLLGNCKVVGITADKAWRILDIAGYTYDEDNDTYHKPLAGIAGIGEN